MKIDAEIQIFEGAESGPECLRLLCDRSPFAALVAASSVPDSLFFEHRSREIFPAASLIKLSILWHFYERLFADASIEASELIELKEENKVGGHGVLKTLPPGGLFRLKDLAVLMIVLSDNVATNLLIDRLGMEEINRSIRSLGLTQTKLARKACDWEARDIGKDNLTTPWDIYLLLREALSSSKPWKEEFLSVLQMQQCRNKFPFYTETSDVALAHKTGEVPGIEHDAGIFRKGERALILVAMTKNLPANETGIEFCRDAARLATAAYFGGPAA